jgi:kynurenine formamidase
MTSESLSVNDAQELARQQAYAPGAGQFPQLGLELLSRPEGQVIDLTRPLYEGMPMGYFHQKTYISLNQDHEGFRRQYKTDAGFAARTMVLSEHAGTHTDAIYEYDADGPTLDKMPLEFFWGEAVCLDMSHVVFCNPDPEGQGYAGVDEVKLAEERLAAAGEEIRAGDIVLLWYDVGDKLFPSQEYMDSFPGLAWDGGEYLAQKGVVNIGSECAGVDNSLDPQFSIHMLCKKYGIVNTESLTNLKPLVNKRFMFFGLPLNILGGTGSPIRAFAWLPNP